MANKRKRPQSPKSPTALRTGSPVAREAILRSGGGIHSKQGEYRRRPKHAGRGWDE